MAKTTTQQEKAGLQTARAIYNTLGVELRSSLPEPTAENSKAFGKALAKYDPGYNCFLSTLNTVILGYIRSAETKNPFESLYEPIKEYGGTVKEMFVDAFDATDWGDCRQSDFKDLAGTAPSNVQEIFHERNFNKKVKVSIPEHAIKHAFDSWAGVNDITARIKDTLYTSMMEAEKNAAEELLNIAYKGGWLYPVEVNKSSDLMSKAPLTQSQRDELEKNVMIQQAIVERLGVSGSRKYNPRGVLTMTDIDDIRFFLTPEQKSSQRVGVLASSFNMDKAEFMGKIITVPGYGDSSGDIEGMIFDRDWFRIIPSDRQVTWFYNSATRTYNYFYFVEATFSFSLFRNAIVLVNKMQKPTAITIPEGQFVYKGMMKPIDFDITVTDGNGAYYNKCNWTLTGNNSRDTFITGGGVLYVASDETASQLTITAKYALNESVASSPATVTVKS